MRWFLEQPEGSFLPNLPRFQSVVSVVKARQLLYLAYGHENTDSLQHLAHSIMKVGGPADLHGHFLHGEVQWLDS